MDWGKMAANFDQHPQGLEAGWHGRELYLLLLRISARFRLDGRIPSRYLSPGFLKQVWGCPEDFPFETAVKRCSVSGLLVTEPLFDGLIIDGWKRWHRPTSTERVRKFREIATVTKTKETQNRTEQNRVDRKIKDSLSTNVDAVAVLDAYRLTLDKPKARLTAGKVRLVKARLAEGHTVIDLCLVPTGVKLDPWPERPNHNSFEIVFREGNVEKFLDFATNGAARGAKAAPDYMNHRPPAGEVTDF